MKKILFLMDHFKNPYAGTEGQLYALVKGLQEQHIQTELAVFRTSEYINNGQFPGKTQVLNITKMFHIMTLIRLIKLARYCRRENYELIHIYFNDASVIAPMILSLSGLKVIISRRDMGYWYNSKLLKILRWNARFHQGCICNSDAVKKITMEQEHIPQKNMHVVYNGLPKSKIPEQAEEYTLYQIGLVANIRPIKRIEDLIKALKIVRQQVADASVVVVGGGDAESLRSLAADYGVEDAVTFAGAQSDVTMFIKQCQVMTLCSESEGLSNAIMEYMAYCKPVVCSDVGGNAELVEHKTNGYLYPVGDVDALAKYILLLLQDPEQAEALGQNGYEKITNVFSIENMIKNTLKVYHKIISI